MRRFYQIQRLYELPAPSDSGGRDFVGEALASAAAAGNGITSDDYANIAPVIRAGLGFDYMGYAEFEQGEQYRSARRIVSATAKLEVIPGTLRRPTYEEDVYFVTSEEHASRAIPVWKSWANDPRTLEAPHYFRDAEGDRIPAGDRTVAWWGLNEDLIWTRDQALAEKLKEGFTRRKQEIFDAQPWPKKVIAHLSGKAPK